MSLVFLDSCEDVSWLPYRYTAGSTPPTNTTGRDGNGAWEHNASGLNSFVTHYLVTADDELWVGFALKPHDFNASADFLTLLSDSGTISQIVLVPTVTSSSVSTIDVERQPSSTLETSSVSLLVDQWYYIEFYCKLGDSPDGAYTLKVDGVTVAENLATDTHASGSTTFDAVRFGGTHNSTGNSAFDDIYVCDSAGSVNNGFIGDIVVEALSPNGNGNSSQFVGSDADSTNNYLLVDETAVSAADYVEASTANYIDSYTYEDLTAATGTVLGTQLTAIAAKTLPATKQARLKTRVASTYYTGTDTDLNMGATALTEIRETNPNTASAWTISDVNGAEFGIEAL
jgi:hypothetical protein